MAEKTLIEGIREALDEELARDPSVFVTGEDVGPRGGVFRATMGLFARYGPNRVIDSPLAEASIVAIGIGAALNGMRPVCEIQFADFIHPAYNQIVNEAARMYYRTGGQYPVPMVIRTPYGGGIGGGLYHSQSIEATFAHVPGLKVVVPSSPHDAKGLLKSAIRDNNPVLFFEHKFLYRRIKEEMPEGDHTVPLGKAVTRCEGRDLTIVTYAAMMHTSLEAANVLAQEGIDAEVIDLRTLLPLDKDAVLESVRKTNKLLVVHEDTRTGGIAGEIAAIVFEEAFEDLDGPVLRVAALDTPVPYAPSLEERFLPQVKDIVEKARQLAKY